MGLALIYESMVLSNWLEEQGFGPVGLTGISMGGHNCSLSASLWPKPVATVPCLSWITASPVFTEGAFKTAVCWDKLESEIFNCKLGKDERRRKVFDKVVQRYGHSDLLSLLNTYNTDKEEGTVVKGQRSWIGRSKAKSMDTPSCPRPATLQIMKHVMDYSTHFHNYPRPVDPQHITFLLAKDDLYVPRSNASDASEIWPG
jgi:hypothetical protein